MYGGDKSASAHQQEFTGSTGLYVDIENLHADGQAMVQRLVENWPADVPPLSRLALYVPANQVELWKAWATNRFNGQDVVVNGTQHFSLSASKNSADIAIATNAMADLVFGRVTHVVVFSDDSDFISLFMAINNEPDILRTGGRIPFTWVVTDREGSLSATVRQFFPPDYLHIVGTSINEGLKLAKASEPNPPGGLQNSPVSSGDLWVEMAQAIAKGIDAGQFKSTDCQPIIRELWPDHPLASAGGPAFGAEFENNIRPVLEGWGVKITSSPGKNPIRYEMTEEVKRSLPEGPQEVG